MSTTTREERTALKAQGICPVCKERPLAPGKLSCAVCCEYRNQMAKKFTARKKKERMLLVDLRLGKITQRDYIRMTKELKRNDNQRVPKTVSKNHKD